MRIPMDAEVRFHTVPEGDTRQGSIENISGSGILFSSETQIEAGTLLSIEVTTPTQRQFSHAFEPLRATVRVVRVTGDNPPYSVAAEFIQLSLP